ncbi:ATP-binding protein [Roseivirga misakiensis]|uniref:histidine kinase n=1 Tax=Roseivirga misakiensis TaxID=1563681 RepID=A0A1E5T775_9BACT|nr:ATP-binding protein [Roseivirga misakiensis]OEK07231.1 histidine kinase [Roseivirga misakiensis]
MKNPFKGSFNIDFYTNQSTIKWIVLVVAVIIGVGSIIYTNSLVAKLKKGEEDKIRLWAKAVEFSSSPDADPSALTFISLNLITPDNTLPVIVIDSATQAINQVMNVSENLTVQQRVLEKMKKENKPFKILIRNGEGGTISDVQFVYYRNSYLLRQLGTYPYVQLSVIAIFAFIAYLAFSYSRKSEQNRVWVGMAKETAHQLGTPLSSLIAWVEYMKGMAELEGRDDIIVELEKDIKRLEMITERFSNIGSVPVLKSQNVFSVIDSSLNYLKPRVSSKVNFKINTEDQELTAKLNKPLFEWVLENIVKNGVDAMSGIGNLNVTIGELSESEIFIDIADDGKGIVKGGTKDVFKPGFTTKKRGWGLGLTLVKRIIENYHEGRIFVKSSQADVGTVFRIVLKG